MIWLSDRDVSELLDPLALMEALAIGFCELEKGIMHEPASLRMNQLGPDSAYLTLFPAHHKTSGMVSAKVLVGDPAQGLRGQPEIDAIVALADAASARIVALIEARQMTALRTAAVTALAVRTLRAGMGPGVVGVIGCGCQGSAHARVFAAAGLASRLLVASSNGNEGRAGRFAVETARATGLDAAAMSADDLVRQADVLVTATLSVVPVFRASPRPGAIVAVIGPFLPEAHEIDPVLCADAALIVTDHRDRLIRQWAARPADIHSANLRLVGLGDLLARRGAASSTRLSLFFSDGRGFEDNVAARLVFAAAHRQGRGLKLR